MKLISWNVNGLRACMTKGFMDFFNSVDADVFAFKNLKCSKNKTLLNLKGILIFGIARLKRAILGW